jgi:dTMP kinase
MTFETELLLYLAARSQHTAQLILPAIEQGSYVICDRYSDSTFAYQGAARKLDIETVRSLNNFATMDLVPDLTILVDISVELFSQRLANKKLDRLESESIGFHLDVRNAYLLMANNDKRFYTVDGNRDIQTIHKDIIEIVLEKGKKHV